MRTRGFTLLELLMVMVITGILAATLTVFLRPAIDSYLDTRRRATLSDMADTALRRMSRDIRSAVPNSLRTATINGNLTPNCFQLVPTTGGGRYRMARDAFYPLASVSAPLDTTTTTSSFDVFNPMAPNVLVGGADPAWIVINNQNGNDVYDNLNRGRIAAVVPPPAPGGVTVGQHRVTLQLATQFSPGYEGGRFAVVSNNGGNQTVAYSCIGDRLLRGESSFNTGAAAACAAANQVVATQVRNCEFNYIPNQGATQQSGFIQMAITLGDGTENVTLIHGVHVENTP